jgi:predicted glycogen debranching enzyme
MIHFDGNTCGEPGLALSREWLETNGIGGYCSSTITGLNTRRYHGLLIAATRPPLGRILMLSKLEETLILGGRRHDLSVNQYGGVLHPRGDAYQTGFRLEPFPIFTYEVEGIVIEKSVLMVRGENTTAIQYQLRAKGEGAGGRTLPSADCSFEVRPLIAFRDYHSLIRENGVINSEVRTEGGLATVKPYEDLPALYLAHDAAAGLDATAFWYRNFEYRVERARGFDFTEDLFSPFVLKFDPAAGGGVMNLVASTERRDAGQVEGYIGAETARRGALRESAAGGDDLVSSLTSAADQYIVSRGRERTIIAGYHWFSDWGRDTMIALPGLTLATRRFDDARSILLEFSRHVDCGMLPNRFPDAGETPEYNTVDATLWYFEAVRSLLPYTKGYEFVRARLYDVLADIVDWHVRGTRYGIGVGADGLLHAGEAGVQLTWMDAKVGDWVVTPRRGKPVEIQALWYNALKFMSELAAGFADEARRRLYEELAEGARATFNDLFWNEDEGSLFDVVDGDARDASVRPNQIFSISLPHSMLSKERALSVLYVVERDLLTPYGLRSLSPRDPGYRPRYEGDSLGRDGAYHQGTVWAWLMGPFITAYVKAHDRSPAATERARAWLSGFHSHLSEAGLGHISEIFDGDAPHTPNGCIAQAWSVAEVLRVLVEDLGGDSRA